MSSDNGIYILKTPKENGFEYRVTHAQAIDNLWWENEDGNPKEIVAYFGSCRVFTSDDEAFLEAKRLYDDYGYTEYGIIKIDMPLPFSEYELQASKRRTRGRN
jgi:hypothetical protein